MKRFLSLAMTLMLIATITPLSTAQSVQPNAQTIINDLVYKSNLGFSVLFPPHWKSVTTTQRNLDWGPVDSTESIDFRLSDKLIFNLSVHEFDQWGELQVEYEGTIPELLGSNETQVVSYTISDDLDQATLEDLNWILENVTIHNTIVNDIANSDHNNAIQYLIDKVIVEGYEDSTFKPDQSINRAELIKITVAANDATPLLEDYNNCFPDVAEEWFAPFICYAKHRDWIQGYPDGTFKPDQNVNKAEALKIIINAQGLNIPGAVNDYLFDDINNSHWYAPFVKVAKNKGLLTISDKTYGIDQPITRGEVSANMYRALLVNAIASIGQNDASSEDDEPSSKESTESGADDEGDDEDQEATVDSYSLFISESFKFSIEYPDQWYYEGVDSEDEGVARQYNFGPGLVDDEEPLVILELRSGEAPDGTIIEVDDKTLILTEETSDAEEGSEASESVTNIYYQGTRLYHLSGNSTYQESMIHMASSIKAVEDTEEDEDEEETSEE